ncbi:MAG: hypothetical protein ABIH00_11645 [Armatimonadota bacterium]
MVEKINGIRIAQVKAQQPEIKKTEIKLDKIKMEIKTSYGVTETIYWTWSKPGSRPYIIITEAVDSGRSRRMPSFIKRKISIYDKRVGKYLSAKDIELINNNITKLKNIERTPEKSDAAKGGVVILRGISGKIYNGYFDDKLVRVDKDGGFYIKVENKSHRPYKGEIDIGGPDSLKQTVKLKDIEFREADLKNIEIAKTKPLKARAGVKLNNIKDAVTAKPYDLKTKTATIITIKLGRIKVYFNEEKPYYYVYKKGSILHGEQLYSAVKVYLDDVWHLLAEREKNLILEIQQELK